MTLQRAQSATDGPGAREVYGAPAESHAGTRGGDAHMVQFYEDEPFLAGAVAEFLGAGLAAAQPLLVVATRSHRKAFAKELTTRGFDVTRAEHSGQLTWLDAHDTLAAFMDGASPDAVRFRSVIGGAMMRARHGRDDTVVRAFGEMVNLLWADGNTDGAVRLEQLWNDLASEHAFSLLCAYSLDGFDDVADAAAFGEICGHHTRVFPTERYAEADDDARLREVSLLQQRARSLETEIARRADLEQRLHRTELDLQAYLAHAGDAVSRARDEFLSVMSHELRTPLNAIGGHAGLLELGVHGPITESQREALARIQKNQRHLLGLINEVLNYTRIETGAVTFQVSDVRIGDLVASVAALVRPQIAAKRLSLTVEPCACVPDVVVRVDAEKVQQILLNLLSNAAKFTHADGVITLACDSIGSCDTCDTCCTGDSAVRVHVRDTGIGITPAKLASVFDPFVQVNAGFARDHDGAGLGLAISRDLARAMGGDLVATSVVDVGSEFTLLLPRVG